MADCNLRGLNGWIYRHGRYIVPLLDRDAHSLAARLFADAAPLFSFDDYVAEQDGWFVGLCYAGADAVQIDLTASRLVEFAAVRSHGPRVKELFEFAAGLVAMSNPEAPPVKVRGVSFDPIAIHPQFLF